MSIPVLPAIETRDVPAEFEIRETSDGFHFTGYAAVFDSPSEPLPFIETVRAGAFSRTISQPGRNIRMLVDHNPERLLATTQAPTLRLSQDSRGLLADADVAPTSYGNDLRILMERRDVTRMSFKFAPNKGGERWTDDGMKRDLLDVKLFEVSVLTGNDPAYAATSAAMRSLQDLAGFLLADVDALGAAIDKLRNGQPLMASEASLLEAAIEHLEPADADEDDMQMNALPSPIHLMQTRRLRLLELAHFV